MSSRPPAGLGQAPGFGCEPDGGVDDPVANEFVVAPRGLFPAPVAPDTAACAAASDNFLFLGKLLARCMMDGRLFDLPLSPLVFKVPAPRHTPLSRAFSHAKGRCFAASRSPQTTSTS